MFNVFNLAGMPRLPERQNNSDKFSMSIVLETKNGRTVSQWRAESRLKRNLALYKERNEEFALLCRCRDKGKALLQFWLNMALDANQEPEDWEPDDRKELALEHLASYCEESCYWAAKKVWQDSKERSWEEYLWLARIQVYQSDNFLEICQRYNEQRSSFDTYIQKFLFNQIKTQSSIGKFSGWRLLYKKSDKELREALQYLGRREPEISFFILARKYFKQVYLINTVKAPARKSGQKWPDPKSEDFEATAQLYNGHKSLPSAPYEVRANSGNVTGEQIKEWMRLCITALQNYPKSINPRFSLEALQEKGREAEYEETQDFQEPEWQSSGEFGEPTTEFQGSRTNSVLREQLENLKPEQKKILLLYYGIGLNQKQIAVIAGVNQATISRHLSRSKVKLLETVVGLSQPTGWVKEYVAGWLQQNYSVPQHSDLIQAALVAALKKLDPQARDLLRLRYGQRLDEQQIVHQLGMNPTELTELLSRAKHQLQADLLDALKTWIQEYLEKWLSRYCKSIYLSALRTLDISLQIELATDRVNAVLEICLETLSKSNQ